MIGGAYATRQRQTKTLELILLYFFVDCFACVYRLKSSRKRIIILAIGSQL